MASETPASVAVLSGEQRELAELLLAAGQGHLFADWSAEAGADADAKAAFFEQVTRGGVGDGGFTCFSAGCGCVSGSFGEITMCCVRMRGVCG